MKTLNCYVAAYFDRHLKVWRLGSWLQCYNSEQFYIYKDVLFIRIEKGLKYAPGFTINPRTLIGV